MSRGFSLVEVLVALAVLSLGLLGAAGMLLNSLRDQSLALRHLAAHALVADMAERIRAHPAARGLYDTAMPGTAAPSVAGTASDSASLAARDLTAFEAGVRALLPNQDARISIAFAPAIGPNDVSRNCVRIAPGSITDTSTPNGFTSKRSASLIASTANFVA